MHQMDRFYQLRLKSNHFLINDNICRINLAEISVILFVGHVMSHFRPVTVVMNVLFDMLKIAFCIFMFSNKISLKELLHLEINRSYLQIVNLQEIERMLRVLLSNS